MDFGLGDGDIFSVGNDVDDMIYLIEILEGRAKMLFVYKYISGFQHVLIANITASFTRFNLFMQYEQKYRI